MNLAIEYMIRSGSAAKSINIPCSILLNHDTKDKKLVVTIHDYSEKQYLVQHWQIDQAIAGSLPNPFKYVIYKDQVFTSDHVIVPEYSLMRFIEKPYKCGQLQRGTGIKALRQESEYEFTINNFFYPLAHLDARISWLWRGFTISMGIHNHSLPIQTQMRITKNSFNFIWERWLIWMNSINLGKHIAPELVFAHHYSKRKIKDNQSKTLESI